MAPRHQRLCWDPAEHHNSMQLLPSTACAAALLLCCPAPCLNLLSTVWYSLLFAEQFLQCCAGLMFSCRLCWGLLAI
jgi:hypothetical protein